MANKEFNDVLDEIRQWDGKNVRSLLPLVERADKIALSFCDYDRSNPDYAGDMLIDIQKSAEEAEIEHIVDEIGDLTWFVADPTGQYLFFHYDAEEWRIADFQCENWQAYRIARDLRDWMVGRTAADAGAQLCIPKRTVEYVLAGRGFRYPDLLRLAMIAVDNSGQAARNAARRVEHLRKVVEAGRAAR